MQVLTITPIAAPFAVKGGVDEFSSQYLALKASFAQLGAAVLCGGMSEGHGYSKLEEDDKTPKLFTWLDEQTETRIHVFPHHLAIAELLLEVEAETPADIESEVQARCSAVLADVYARFVQFLRDSLPRLGEGVHAALEIDLDVAFKLHWVSRTLVLSQADLSDAPTQQLLQAWLADTLRPEDAQALIDGERDHSMTWLNYVIVDRDPVLDMRVEAMILAQYFYTTQEVCNDALRESIESAYLGQSIMEAEQKLESSRVVTRLHLIAYHDYLKFFNRNKKKRMLEILQHWEFDALVDNGYRMIDVASSKLQEVDAKRKDRSNLMTDLLLVALSFFTVFELSLFLVQFSREMLSRPTLDYTDESSSFFLETIARIDTDYMFASGAMLTLVLILIYRFMKFR